MKSILLGLAASIAVLGAASAASAATIVDDFTFYDSAHDPIATGSFSYDSSHTGLLTYNDLENFSVTLLGGTYDLNFVKGLTSSQDYVYFGYDTLTKSFDPAAISGYTPSAPPPPPYSGILAGLGASPNTGFFFDPIAGQADPAHTGADGIFARYNNGAETTDTATSFVVVGVVPEPATWAMMILGLGGLGVMARTGRRKLSDAGAVAEG